MFSGLFGNVPSKINSKSDLEKKVNVIFTDYILKQSFNKYDETMNLKDYDDKIYTTKETLEKALSKLETKEIEMLSKEGNNVLKKKKEVIVLNNSNLKKNIFDAKHRKAILDKNARFYVKLHEIYNAIVATLDPVYSYTNNNKEVFFRLSEYKEHLQKIKDKPIQLRSEYSNSSVVNKRLEILKTAFDSSGNPSLNMNKVCSVDLQNDKTIPTKLIELKGMKELEMLFMDLNINSSNS